MQGKKKGLKPGDFREGREHFTRLRKQKPSKAEVLSILDKGIKNPSDERGNSKIASHRNVET